MKTVCIIGAGESGIAALKECVSHGLRPTCYEMDTDIGGLWHEKPDDQARNTPAVWPNLVTNNSKYNVCFSDYAPDPKDPVFLSPKQMCAYFKRVIAHFELEKYIHLGVKVELVTEADDHEQTGRWSVHTKEVHGDLASAQQQIFDFVIVCSGWFKTPYYPDITGLDKFRGSISHSFTYSDPRPFDGKNVLVVGNKFSAAEIVTDVACLAKETHLALGQGTWIVPRMFQGQRPLDLSIPRKLIHASDPEYEVNELFIRQATSNMDHTASGVGSVAPPTRAPICISDDLPVKIASGHIKPYSNLVQLSENSAIFKEGETIQNLDAVIFCTGYRTELPFLQLPIHDADGKMELYMMTFPLGRKRNTLALVGHYGTDGPMVVLGENQARLVAAVMSGRHKLPSPAAMAKNAAFWNQASRAARPKLHSFLVPGFAFMDAIAMEMGFYPSFWKLVWRDPLLAWRTWTGPYLAAQYRLLGPGSQWGSARRVCYQGFREGLSCIRHGQACEVDRPDKRRRRRNMRIVAGLGVVGLMAGAGYVWSSRS